VGLLYALLISSACSALVLPWLFGRRYHPVISWAHITESLHYSVPIVIGYIAYFVLNRISTLILQRHVAVDQIAIFGLAQQLAMILTIAANAFGKALQPIVFAAELDKVAELMIRTGKILMLLMFCITSLIVLFASEIFSLIAPKNYMAGYDIFLILLIASFVYSFSLISNTTLLYHRRPKTSVAVTIVGAILSASLGAWLIPLYHLHGAALTIVGAFFAMTLLSHWAAHRVTGHSYLAPMTLAIATIFALSLFAVWMQHQGFPLLPSLGFKLAICLVIFPSIYLFNIRKRLGKS